MLTGSYTFRWSSITFGFHVWKQMLQSHAWDAQELRDRHTLADFPVAPVHGLVRPHRQVAQRLEQHEIKWYSAMMCSSILCVLCLLIVKNKS